MRGCDLSGISKPPAKEFPPISKPRILLIPAAQPTWLKPMQNTLLGGTAPNKIQGEDFPADLTMRHDFDFE